MNEEKIVIAMRAAMAAAIAAALRTKTDAEKLADIERRAKLGLGLVFLTPQAE